MHFTSISRSGYLGYLEKEATEKAYWQGKAAEKLGIAGEEVTPKSFNLLCEGIDPVHGEVLRPRERHSLTRERNGKREEYAWPVRLYDGTFPASKHVSIVSILDERVSAAHLASVREVLPSMEALAACNNRNGWQRTGNAIYAVYEHRTNRLLEPHEHAHIATINLTHDEHHGKWKALAAYDMYRSGTPLQERYREILAERVANLGYRITAHTNVREWWGIEGVTPALLSVFSQRTADLQLNKEEFEKYHGREPLPGETAVLAHTNRPKKDKVYPPVEEIRERQLARLSPVERESLVTLKERAAERQRPIAIEDHVEHEAPAEYHRPWSYGEKKQRAY